MHRLVQLAYFGKNWRGIMKKYLLYVPCALLIMFYLYVIFLGFKPQVSDQYRAYYIDHTISQWPE